MWKIDAAVPTAGVRPEASNGPTAPALPLPSNCPGRVSEKRENEFGRALAARNPAGGGGSVPLDVEAKHSRMHAMTITHSASTLGFSHAYDELCLKAIATSPSPRSVKRRLNLRREAARQTQCKAYLNAACGKYMSYIRIVEMPLVF